MLVLFNGSDDASYNAFDLDGHTIAAQDFFVIGNAAVPNVDFVINDNTLQNGADAVALFVGNDTDFPNDTQVTITNLVDALAYDTNDADDAALLAGLNLTTQFNEDENGKGDTESISRLPDGTTTIVTHAATPGVTNVPLAITITETSGSTLVTEDGPTDQFSVALSVNPATNVVLNLSSSFGVTLSATQLTFTPANGTTAQAVTVRAIDDNDAHGNRSSPITIRVNDTLSDDAFDNLSDVTVAVTIVDDDFPGIVLEHSNSTTHVAEAGTTDVIRVRLTAAPPSDVVVDLTTSTDDITLSTSQLTFTSFNATQPQTVTVSATQDDRIEGLESATVTATVNTVLSNGTFSGVSSTSLAVSITDDDEAGFTLTPSLSPLTVSEAGTSTTVAAALTAQPESTVTLVLSTSDAGEATVSPATLTFTTDAWDQPQTLTITGVLDTEDDPDQGVTIMAAIDAAASDPNFADVANQSLSVSVTSVNGIMAVDDVATTLEDTPISMDVRANDFDPAQSPLTLAIVTSPAHGTASVDDAGTPNDVSDDIIVYTPADNRTDAITFTYSITVDDLSATATVTVNITPVNDPPLAVDDAVTIDEDTTIEIDVLANDLDPERSELVVSLVAPPNHGIITLANQGTPRTRDDRFLYTPNGDFTGEDRFVYRIMDSQGLSDEATVRLTVTGTNDAPVATDDLFETTPGKTATVLDVLANDQDPEGTTLTIRLVTGSFVTLGTVATTPDGVSYTPPKAEFQGMDRFAYEIVDGEGAVSNQAKVTVVVFPSLSGSPSARVTDRAAPSAPAALQRQREPSPQLQQLHLKSQLESAPKTTKRLVQVAGTVIRAWGRKRLLYDTNDTPYLAHLPEAGLATELLFREGERIHAILSARPMASFQAFTLEQGYTIADAQQIAAPEAVTADDLLEQPERWQHHLIALEGLSARRPGVEVEPGRYVIETVQGASLTLLVAAGAPLVGSVLPAEPLAVTGIFMTAEEGYEVLVWEENDVQASTPDLSRVAGEVPEAFALEGNYPNPFNPSTVIRFSVPEAVHVTLEVYNVLGERVAVVASQEYAAGRYEHRFDGRGLASGMYLYRMVAGDFVQVNRMLLMK